MADEYYDLSYVGLDADDSIAKKHQHTNKTVLDNTEASYTTTEETKLDGIEAGATTNQTGAEIKAAYESQGNTNAYTDAEKVIVGNTSNTNSGDQDITDMNTNTSKLSTIAENAEVNTINSDPTGITGADQVTNIMSLTQSEYDAIVTPVTTTLYFISG